MKRRDFLKMAPVAAASTAMMINGLPIQSFAEHPLLHLLAKQTQANGRVMVFVQLNGGNDGLNTLIPLDQYSALSTARGNILIPQNQVLPLAGFPNTGLHPAMNKVRDMYVNGMVNIVQSVSYPTPNFSHFRATDIWMSASDSTTVVNSGWAGRFLDAEFPNFPNGYPNASMTDPLAIQIGSATSLTFQGPAVSMGMSISNTSSFYNLINGVRDTAPNTPAGKELNFVRMVAQQTQQYAAVIKDAAAKVPTQVTYPTGNSLADQLKIVARLIKGGLKTRVYMVNFGGFDTHASQVNASDTATGSHATLLGRVSDAIRAFQKDLKFLGVDDRVAGMTFSEFGRRVKSNGSVGTDHGAAAPLFVFGKNVIPGVLGATPKFGANVSVGENVPFEFDFRSVYATLLSNWLCVSDTDLEQIMLKNFQTLPLVNAAACKKAVNLSGEDLVHNYPNPFTSKTVISFKTAGGHTLIQVMDMLGRVITNLTDRDYAPGTYTVVFDSGSLPTGVYYARLQNMSVQQVHTMLKVK